MGDATTAHAQPCTGSIGRPHRVDDNKTYGARFVLKLRRCNTTTFSLMTLFKVGNEGVEEDGVVLGREEMKTPVASAV